MNAIDTWQDTRPALACLRNKGVSIVGRYYSASDWKRLSKAEALALSDAGFTIFVVYQNSNNAYDNFSHERGVTHARAALKYAIGEIGQPAGSAIYFAVDYDATGEQAAGKIADYFEAVNAEFAKAAVPYKIGVYGNGVVCAKLLEAGLVAHTWLSMSKGHHGHAAFYASGKWSLCQQLETTLCGLDVDPDETNPAGDFGGFSLRRASVESAAKAVRYYVKTDGLNFRERPDGAIIRALTLADPVEVLGEADDAQWKRVRIGTQEGYVAGRYLRVAENDQVEALLRNAVREWVRFEKGRGQEEVPPYRQYVGEMWQALGFDYDGASTYPNGEDVPWSAAFISFAVRQSGSKYSDFHFSDRHSEFVHDAIQARLLSRTDRPFWGYRITERRPALGDIVARNRDGKNFSFDHAETNSDYKSHSDIVVEVRDNVIRVMGGNVSDTVSARSIAASGDDLQDYDLDAEGYIKPGQKVIALLKNRAAEV